MYLSKNSLDCEIVSATSSEMNILVPEGEDDFVSEFIFGPTPFISTKIYMIQIPTQINIIVVVLFESNSALQREFPVPEQFKTVWDGSSLVTEPTKIAG